MLNKAIINLKFLRENAFFVKKRLKNTKFYAVVKADAYGHDAVKCANAIYDIADGFCVCLLEEAVALRNGGIDKEILLFTPVMREEIERAVFYSLSLTVSSIREINFIKKEAKRQNKRVKIHLKYNTGMNRQGVNDIYYLKKLIAKIKESEFLVFAGFYSHLYAPDKDKELKKQVEKFEKAVKIVKEQDDKVMVHLSASGGFLKGVYYDMVRIGILLYGYSPFNNKLRKIKPVMQVKSFVLKTRSLKRGDKLLYGDNKLIKNERVKLVRFGYADGLFRAKNGDLANRCMDLSMVKIKKNEKKQKDFYILSKNAYYLAKKYDTISYEILVNVSKRAEKIFIY